MGAREPALVWTTLLAAILGPPPAVAQQVLRRIDPAELLRGGALSEGVQYAAADATSSSGYVLARAEAGPTTRTIVTLVDPGITQARYALLGEVRCEDVQGEAYLETQNYFADGNAYFSRAVQPPAVQRLSGTSGWRFFLLPFDCVGPDGDTGQRPTRVELRLSLSSSGTVALRGLTLQQYAPGEALLLPGQWWSERTAAMVGGGLGGLIGVLGGLIGLLAGLGRGRRLAVGLMLFMLAAGIAALAAGTLALTRSQPYAVYYPLLLIGSLCTLLPLTLLPVIRRRYAQQELRRMHARDAA